MSTAIQRPDRESRAWAEGFNTALELTAKQAGPEQAASLRARMMADGPSSQEIDASLGLPSNWRDTAMQHHRNEEYYRGLVIRIGAMLGPDAYTSDDGSVQQDVLCAKVPELVAALIEKVSRGRE